MINVKNKISPSWWAEALKQPLFYRGGRLCLSVLACLIVPHLIGPHLIGAPAMAQTDGPVNGMVNEPVDERVDEVVVSATGMAIPREQTGSSVSVFDEADIERLQASNISDLLAHMPGLSVDREGIDGGIGYIRMRGLDRQYVSVVLDGISLGDPADAYGSAELSNFLSAGIGRIEVLRGSHSVLYGSNAIAGVISLSTPRFEGPLTSKLSLEAGSRDLWRTNILLGGGDKLRGFVQISDERRRPRSDFSDTIAGFSESEDYENQSLLSRFEVDLAEAHQLVLLTRLARTSAERDGYDANFNAVDGWFGEDTHEWMSQLAYHYAPSASDQVSATVSYFSRDRDSFEDPIYSGSHYWNDGARLRTALSGQFSIGEAVSLNLGVAHANERFAQNNLTRKIAELRSVYLMAHYQLTPLLATSFGARLDHHDRFGDHDSYRWAMAYQAFDGIKLRASYGTGYRAPSLYELYGEDPYCTNNLCGNRDLTPEVSTSYDVGLEIASADLLWDLTAFRVRTEDKIIFSFANGHYENDYGRSDSEGVEAGVHWLMSDQFTTSFNATYLDPRNSDGTIANKQPRQILSLDTQYAWANGQGQIGIFLRDVSHRYIYAVRQEDYLLVGLRGQWALNEGLDLTAQVENAFNEEYTVSYGYPPRTTPRRAVTLGIRARF